MTYNFLSTPRFPTGISYGSEGGPNFNTRIVPLKSGALAKNRVWQFPMHTYNVLPGVKTATALEDLREYFYVMYGQDGLFRFKDFSDYKSCPLEDTPANDDQSIGTGDGVTDTFAITKTYQKGAMSLERPIRYPLNSTIKVAVAGVSSAAWTQLPWPNTHQIQFSTGAIPATGQAVTVGFEFDVLCAFRTDRFNVVIQACKADGGLVFNVPGVPIGEELIV